MGEAAPASVGVGTMLAGTYRVTGLLGRGGMGSVWVAEHSRLPGKRVAIKVLHRDVAADDESLARFRREAEIATLLGHPNIVEVHDFNLLDDGTPYLVLELLQGQDLATRLRTGAMPLDEVCSIVRQIGSALATAHRENIVHRDLKPHNVFLCPTESGGIEGTEAKVLDFGISKIRGSQTVKTNAATMLGTPQYMAPEQALGNHAAVDERTDIFALGAMVYEMLSGRPAFLGESIPEVVFKVVYEEPPRLDTLVAVPPGVVDAVHRALHKKQEERFSNVAAFVEALTGSPLNTLRRGAVVAPGDGGSAGAPTQPPPATSSQPPISKSNPSQVKTKEAYAETVGSAPRPIEPAVAGARQADLGLAATIDSSKQPVDAALAATMHSGKGDAMAAAPTEREQAARRRSRPGMWIAMSIAGTAAVVVVGFVALRGSGADGSGRVATDGEANLKADGKGPDGAKPDEPKPGPDGRDTTGPNGTKSAGPDNAGQNGTKPDGPDKAGQDGTKPDTTGPDGTKPDGPDKAGQDGTKAPGDKPKPAGDKPKPPGDKPKPDDGAGDEPTGEQAAEWRDIMSKAEGALRAGDADRAIAEANRSLVLQRTQRALVIKAEAYCLKNDLGMAKATASKIRAPRVRKRIAVFCAAQGMQLD